MHTLASILFSPPEGSSIDDVALAFKKNEPPSEEKVALILIGGRIPFYFLLGHAALPLPLPLPHSPPHDNRPEDDDEHSTREVGGAKRAEPQAVRAEAAHRGAAE